MKIKKKEAIQRVQELQSIQGLSLDEAISHLASSGFSLTDGSNWFEVAIEISDAEYLAATPVVNPETPTAVIINFVEATRDLIFRDKASEASRKHCYRIVAA